EMVWSSVSRFSLVTPTVVGAAEGASRDQGPRIVALGGGEGGDIQFMVSLPLPLNAEIGVYDLSGRKVRALRSGALPGGETIVSWDRRNGDGRAVASGVYFARLKTPLGSRSAKVHVLR